MTEEKQQPMCDLTDIQTGYLLNTSEKRCHSSQLCPIGRNDCVPVYSENENVAENGRID
jgi:hypothetical protein